MIKILFVEDDPDQTYLYKEYFKMRDIVLNNAGNYAETVKAIAEQKPDLILMDILLIKENGMDVMKKLKGDEKYKSIPIWVFTNYVKKGIKEEARKIGALAYIIKNQTTPQEMATRIKKFVQVE